MNAWWRLVSGTAVLAGLAGFGMSQPVAAPDGVGEPWLVADVGEEVVNSRSIPPSRTSAYLDGVLYFQVRNGLGGMEFWRSDGTEEGTTKIDSPLLGYPDTLLEFALLQEIGGKILILTSVDSDQLGLIAYDPNSQTTEYINGSLIKADWFSWYPPFVLVGDKYYSCGTDERDELHILSVDEGLANAASFVPSAITAGTSFSPNGISALEGGAAILGGNLPGGQSLIWTDGTDSGTKILAQFSPNSYFNDFAPYSLSDGTAVLFGVALSPDLSQLWRTDGTEEGTYLVREYNFLHFITEVDGSVLFSARDLNESGPLWRSGGTIESTHVIEGVDGGPHILRASPALNPDAEINGKAVFPMSTTAYGDEYWVSDATEQGTHLLKDLVPGPDGVTNCCPTYDRDFLEVDDYLLLLSENSEENRIWSTDGKAEGTHIVSLFSDPDAIIFLLGGGSGIGYFVVNDDNPDSLWRTDGTSEGTFVVKSMTGDDTSGSPRPEFTMDGDDGIYFNTYPELMYINPEMNEPELVFDPGEDYNIYPIRQIGDYYFLAVHNRKTDAGQLYSIDGTTKTPTRLARFGNYAYGLGNSYPERAIAAGGYIYFAGYDREHGTELWRSDGTPEGTGFFHEFTAGSAGSTIKGLSEYHGVLYFRANDYVWKTDGNLDNTINTGIWAQYKNPEIALLNDGTAILNAWREGTGYEIYKFDTQTDEFSLLFESAPGEDSYIVQDIYNLGDHALVFYSSLDDGPTLVSSDGTAEGTFILDGLEQPSANIAIMNGEAYVRNLGIGTGPELWITDGTDDGTSLLKDILPGGIGSSPELSDTIVHRNRLYFPTYTPEHGLELWRTNGTADGTERVTDLAQGSKSSKPEYLVLAGDILYFSATDGSEIGQELYAIDLAADANSTIWKLY